MNGNVYVILYRLVTSRMPFCKLLLVSPMALADEFLSLWEEYEAQETIASHYVFDFDKLDMLIQANQYEIGIYGSIL